MQQRTRKDKPKRKTARSRIRALTPPAFDEKPQELLVDVVAPASPRVHRVPSSASSGTAAAGARVLPPKRRKKRVWVPVVSGGLPGLPKRGR